jgi:hypothetical protein
MIASIFLVAAIAAEPAATIVSPNPCVFHVKGPAPGFLVRVDAPKEWLYGRYYELWAQGNQKQAARLVQTPITQATTVTITPSSLTFEVAVARPDVPNAFAPGPLVVNLFMSEVRPYEVKPPTHKTVLAVRCSIIPGSDPGRPPVVVHH